MTLPFTWAHRGHCRIIKRLNFNLLVSQEIGKPRDRGTDGGMTGQWGSQNTHVYCLCLSSSRVRLWHPKTIIIVNPKSLITDHHNRNNTNEIRNVVRLTRTRQRHEVSQCC